MPESLLLLTAYTKPINDVAAELLSDFSEYVPLDVSDQSLWCLGALRDFDMRGGKRLRGALAAAMYDHKTGKKFSREGLELAVVLELMHDYLLIIDDVMDRSLIRRGGPTLHELYRRDFVGQNITSHESSMIAINIGLLAQHIASTVLMRFPGEFDVRQISQLMNVNLAITGTGQIDDVHQQNGRNISEQEIVRKYTAKSSYYTFVNPLMCGLALANAYDDSAAEDCKAYGIPTGIAFQIHDDFLGIFGESTDTGKGNLDDLHEGKYTLQIQHALSCATQDDKISIEKILGNEHADSNDLEQIKRILIQSGTIDYVNGIKNQMTEQAKAAVLNAKCWDSDFANLLESIIDFSVKRTK